MSRFHAIVHSNCCSFRSSAGRSNRQTFRQTVGRPQGVSGATPNGWPGRHRVLQYKVAASAAGQRAEPLHRPAAHVPGGDGLTAVVLGAGPTGLATANALRPLFDEVVLVEREVVDEAPMKIVQQSAAQAALQARRRGVPQSRISHVLLRGGLEAAADLFGPRVLDRLAAAGAVPLNWITDMDYHAFGSLAPNVRVEGDSGTDQVSGFTCTRALVESVIRQETLADRSSCPGGGGGGGRARAPLTFLNGHSAAQVVLDDSGRTVTGVQLRDGTVVRSDLLVDATGLSSVAPRALQAAGRGAVPEERVESDTVYAACIMQPLPASQPGGRGTPPPPEVDRRVTFVVAERPHCPHMGMVWPVEGGLYQVALMGPRSDPPPRDFAAWEQYAGKLASPLVARRLQRLRPAESPKHYRNIKTVWRRYDKADMPEGLAVVGDAVCVFNPVYGQGMTVGLQGARALRDAAAERLTSVPRHDVQAQRRALRGFGQDFQARLADIVAFPFSSATAEDLIQQGRAPEQPGVKDRAVGAYMNQLFRAAQADSTAQLGTTRVMHLAAPSSELFKPRFVIAATAFWLNSLAGRRLLSADSGRA